MGPIHQSHLFAQSSFNLFSSFFKKNLDPEAFVSNTCYTLQMILQCIMQLVCDFDKMCKMVYTCLPNKKPFHSARSLESSTSNPVLQDSPSKK
jgi:hypothetical protein